jgi:aminoglycoside phosphotransferase family enzyme/predicted kinase
VAIYSEANALVYGLSQPGAYPHPAAEVERLETHISWVFLAGDYAYKVKKPVALPFVDFSTLAARRRYCEEELRLNRRFAPELYLDVVEIRGSAASAHIDGTGEVLDYAVRMRRFPQADLASALLQRGALDAGLLREFGVYLARVHGGLPRAAKELDFGEPARVLRDALDNFDQMAPLLPQPEDNAELPQLRAWTRTEFERVRAALRIRREHGMVRECHGDLHLRNLVASEGSLIAFDCIEFNPGLRWIDVMSDVAFLAMDLFDRRAAELAWGFLNAYLEASGDYEGMQVLRFFLAYRALVRAKVHLIRARQAGMAAESERLIAQFRHYVDLAGWCAHERRGAILLMHGFSGCGKSVLAAALAERLGAVRIRSDVERKRMHGFDAEARSASALEGGLYREGATRATYAKLAAAARVVARAGYPAIVDATFLRRSQRDVLADCARAIDAPLIVIDVQAAPHVLRERVAARRDDPSEATLDVLQHQVATAEPLAPEEALKVVRCESDAPPGRLARMLDEPIRELIARRRGDQEG